MAALWRYVLAPSAGPTAGTPLFSVAARSEFEFADGGGGAAPVIVAHTLRGLRVNNREALPQAPPPCLAGASPTPPGDIDASLVA